MAKHPERNKFAEKATLAGNEPELTGYGVVRNSEGRWLVYRCSSHGSVEFLSPKRAGKNYGQTRHSAAALLMKLTAQVFETEQRLSA